ncbi:MAG: putative sulfate/molybdate transporter [Desulfovibrionaceae bacterium]
MESHRIQYSRMELSGALGDLGTLIPLAVGMIMVNGLSPTGLFLSVGLLYLLGGAYYGVPIAVQPMKVVAAYAITSALSGSQITTSGLLLGVVLLVLGLSGLVAALTRLVPRSVVRGVQFSTGLLLLIKGVEFIVGRSTLQRGVVSEPWLSLPDIPLPGFSVPMSLVIGVVFGVLVLLLIDSRRVPAGLVAVGGGLALGLAFGPGLSGVEFGLHLPEVLPFGLPTSADIGFAFLSLVLPQLPMTLGNAVIANRDYSNQVYPEGEHRVTDRALCVSMGLSNLFSTLVGGMPMCHGAGGLAAHYRFGARNLGSNLFIGGMFVLLALTTGETGLHVVRLLPLGVLGVLLVFGGSQLALNVIDLKTRSELFVCVVMVAIALVSNLAWGFGAGILLARLLAVREINI